MALNTNITVYAGQQALDALVDLVDNGTGNNPLVQIYDGSQPADPDVGVGTQTKLAEIDLAVATVFSSAAKGTGGSASSVTANASANLPKSDTSATGHATKTASWFRCINDAGSGVIDGSVGTSTADMIIDNTSINNGQTVKLNSWKIKLPYK